MKDQEVEGRTENKLGITCRSFKICSQKFEFTIQASAMLQKEISSSSSISTNDVVMPNLPTCARFPVTSVSKVASTAV